MSSMLRRRLVLGISSSWSSALGSMRNQPCSLVVAQCSTSSKAHEHPQLQSKLIRKPQEPDPSECCGNDCRDCVWVEYWKRLQEYEHSLSEAERLQQSPDLHDEMRKAHHNKHSGTADGSSHSS